MPLKRLLLKILFLLTIPALLSSCLEDLSPEDKVLFTKVYGNGGFTTAVDIVKDTVQQCYWILGAEVEEVDNDSIGTRLLVLKVDYQGLQIAQPDTLLMAGTALPIKIVLHNNKRIVLGNVNYLGVTRIYKAVFEEGAEALLSADTVADVTEEKVNDFIIHNNAIVATGYRRVGGQTKLLVREYEILTMNASALDYLSPEPYPNTGERIIVNKFHKDITILANTDRSTTGLAFKNVVFYVFHTVGDPPQATVPLGSSANDFITGKLEVYDAKGVQTVYTFGYSKESLKVENPFILKTNGQTNGDYIPDADTIWFAPIDFGFKDFGNDGVRRIPYDLIKLKSSDLLMAGLLNANDNTQRTGDNIFLMRLESNGNPLYEEWLPLGGQANETLCKLKLEDDESIIVLSTLELNDNSSVISLSRMRIPLKF